MPTIYDNINKHLKDGINSHMQESTRIDACVGYFNLRGWNVIVDKVDILSGGYVVEKENKPERFCRLLVGMIKTPKEILIDSFLDDEVSVI
jgi:hypothetical protein